MELIMIASHFGYDLVAKRKLTREKTGERRLRLILLQPHHERFTPRHYATALRRITTAG
jgi:hypothetical protein